jgi:uncharacterized membrane protein
MTIEAPPTAERDAEAARRVRQIELVISRLLRGGVLLSLGIVLVGTVLTFVHHPTYATSPGEFDRLTSNEASFPTSLADVVRGVGNLEGRAIVTLGLLVLLATPVMRVAVSILAFLHERDHTFAVITSVVLMLLITSLVLGKAGG